MLELERFRAALGSSVWGLGWFTKDGLESDPAYVAGDGMAVDGLCKCFAETAVSNTPVVVANLKQLGLLPPGGVLCIVKALEKNT